jgi:hypothetical protein
MNQTVEATSIADAIDQAELRAAMFDDGERGKLCGVSCRTLGDPLGALAAENATLGAKPIGASLFGSGVVEAYLTGLAWGARERGRA